MNALVAGACIALLACSARPQPVRRPAPVVAADAPSSAAAPHALHARPDVAVPALTGAELPWPLRAAPSLVPRAHIAPSTAADCEWKRPLFAERYASALCFAARGEYHRAADEIAYISKAAPPADQEAAYTDLADLMALGEGTNADLDRLVTMHVPAVAWDIVIASLQSAGAGAAARTLSETQPYDRPDADVACHRHVRSWELAEAHALSSLAVAGGDACVPVQRAAACRVAMSLAERDLQPIPVCAEHLHRAPQDLPAVYLAAALRGWRLVSGRGALGEWLTITEHASHALALPGAAEVAVAAVENASYVADCDDGPPPIDRLKTIARTLADAPELSAQPALQQRAAAVAAFPLACHVIE